MKRITPRWALEGRPRITRSLAAVLRKSHCPREFIRWEFSRSNMYRGEPTRVNLNEGALKFPERAPDPRKSGWERTT